MRFLVLMLFSVCFAQDKPPASATVVPPSKIEVTTASWLKLKESSEQLLTQIRQAALEIQAQNIRLRDIQMEMKDLEMRVQSLLCDKGKAVVMSAKPVCQEVK